MATAETTGVEELVRNFIKSAQPGDERTIEGRLDGAVEEIIFDLEVDGTRYLFIRLPKVSQLPVQLSPREREIVRLVALGHSNKIIAGVLSISSWTVSTHLRRIFAKLGVGSRAAMVAMVAHVAETAKASAPTPASVSQVTDTGRRSMVVTSGELSRERFR